MEGRIVGLIVVGIVVGDIVGKRDGETVGNKEGSLVVGWKVLGCRLGSVVGCIVG
jgi:hypothetical protein